MGCRFYGKLPFCRQCLNDKEMCNYFYENMNNGEMEQFYRESSEELKKKVEELGWKIRSKLWKK